jgi:hypothetical protein
MSMQVRETNCLRHTLLRYSFSKAFVCDQMFVSVMFLLLLMCVYVFVISCCNICYVFVLCICGKCVCFVIHFICKF